MADFADRIKELRLTQKKTLRGLGADLFLSYSTIAGWEGRRNTAPQSMLIALADYFDVSVDYLLGVTDIREKPEALIKKYSTLGEYARESQANRLTKRIAALELEYQAKLADYLELLEFVNAKNRDKADLEERG